MEFIIFYFSGTGNSELISKRLKKRLELGHNTVELVSIEDIEIIKPINFENKIIGFGYPVYKFTFPDIFLNLFSIFNKLGKNNLYFQFCTYARFTADTFYDFSNKLKSDKYKLIAERSFKSPSNGISARKPVDDYEYETVMFFEDDITKKIEEFADEILDNVKSESKIKQKSPNILASLRLRIVKDIEITKYPKLQINRNKCTVCGLCAKKCPDKNLENLQDYIKIIDDKHCLHCLRCMHHCPTNAITFGALSKGENRYTLIKRDELFNKSANGHKEKYWADFERTRKKWRRNTIKYWWKHRKNPEIQ
ncbi:MAG: EFR1 family ferrodoxin [Methanosarcinaceae archaeon]